MAGPLSGCGWPIWVMTDADLDFANPVDVSSSVG
jgi:hypothetical protein